MSPTQLHYSSKSIIDRHSHTPLPTLAIPKPQQPSHNALLQTIYRNLHQKKLFRKSESLLLAATKTYLPVAHHFLSATESFVNEVFLPVIVSRSSLIHPTQERLGFWEEQTLLTHSTQLVRLCGTRALQCLPEKYVGQISSGLKSFGNYRWTPGPLSKLALEMEQYLIPISTEVSATFKSCDNEPSMRTRYRQREHKEHGISRPDSISSTSSINRKYNPASLTASRDEGGSNINAPVIYDEIFTSPSTSSTLSSSNTLSTTSDEMEDWNLRPPPMPFLTPNQLWFGRSTQTIVTLTDVNGKFIYGK